YIIKKGDEATSLSFCEKLRMREVIIKINYFFINKQPANILIYKISMSSLRSFWVTNNDRFFKWVDF
ncbi:MAG: hypothetical protein WCJ33_08925, partial [Pseudomonadota bacterium]